MRGPFVQQRRDDEEESEEARFVVVKKIRDAILMKPSSLERAAGRASRENVQCQPVTCPGSAIIIASCGHNMGKM
jgi:hypothetical protein